ncbi:ATP-grasp domain-containing protein [Prodigiosinella confusarubida]|uniref:ATP-grasp domain-containing protein n=1 Tax=Serratia sp. (strain ATCC 39006) TaxID=104623 RepID=A0A2I5T8X8_SERS3|nr:ATP-grasp domain-containing protein [Serratia sp. ATCC 39006]AUH01030.1 ATP-grasp domain-containing protein [Serratia sp. ATCC 39006]AUH05351.1 ATP-grasp domain-containing protein [Serratia sp. ATCC 39006]
MKKSIILVSQSYLHFASESVLSYLKENIDVILIIHESEEVHPHIKNHITRLYKVSGSFENSLRPVLDFDEVSHILAAEIKRAGSVNDLAIFCQQEDNVLLAAELRAKFNIAGDRPEIICQFRDKIEMKKAVNAIFPQALPKFERLDIESIKNDAVTYYHELVAKLGSKLIIKPTSGAGSFNVKIVDSVDDLCTAVDMINHDEHVFDYEVDEFISGKMYQCDSFIRNGKVVFSGILELGCTNFDFVLGKPLSVYPVSSHELYNKLFAFNQNIITTLGFSDGSTHHELFVKDSGEIIFLEIAARVPGGIGVPYHTKNSNINLIDANLLLSADSPALADIKPEVKNNVVSALLPVGHGKVLSLNQPDIESVYHIDWHITVGQDVDSRSLIDTAGILTFVNDDSVVLRRDFEKLQAWIPAVCG